MSDLEKILYVQLPRTILCKFEYEIHPGTVAVIYWYNYSSQGLLLLFIGITTHHSNSEIKSLLSHSHIPLLLSWNP